MGNCVGAGKRSNSSGGGRYAVDGVTVFGRQHEANLTARNGRVYRFIKIRIMRRRMFLTLTEKDHVTLIVGR